MPPTVTGVVERGVMGTEGARLANVQREHVFGLPQLHLVAFQQQLPLARRQFLAVDGGAVGAAHIGQICAGVVGLDLRVAS